MKQILWLFSLCLCLSAAQPQEHWVATWATAQALAPVAPLGAPPPRPQAAPARPSPDRTNSRNIQEPNGANGCADQHRRAAGTSAILECSGKSQRSRLELRILPFARKTLPSLPASDRVLTFGGRASLTIPPGALVVSDPVDLDVPKFTDLAISLYLPEDTGPPTVHPLGLHTTYIASGDATADATLNPSMTTTAYFWLSGVDVLAPSSGSAIVAFGDSITDGFATTANKDQAWPTLLATRLASSKSTAMLGVLNLGISGNRVLRDVAGTNALARFDRDVLARPGVHWMILLEGINDITFSAIPGIPPGQAVTAEDLIWGYRQIIERAHLHGIKVAGATIMPVEGVPTYTESGEACPSSGEPMDPERRGV